MVLKAMPAVSLVGYADGAYAVVAADDLFPAVLGVSSTKYSNGENPNFEFWLRSISAALTYRAEHNMPAKLIAPDPALYPTSVEPLMTTKWDQLTPYNNLLPTGIYTGCVATAMAQVLNYHQVPEHGFGSLSNNAKGTVITANFEEDYYDWPNMLDEYRNGQYTDVEADAVALLMRDCGVAAKMEYGTAFDGGSGAYSQDAAAGLRKYFGLENAKCVERDSYSAEDWMDMVFNELSTVGPLYYGGADLAQYAGHAFVLHGYREDGMVYVNWGWSGEDDGFYDISLLNPPGNQFSAQQDMIIGVVGDGQKQNLVDTVLTVKKAGDLPMMVDTLMERVASLKLVGKINGSDLRTLRWMAGCDENLGRTKGRLNQLDLSEAHIISGGDAYIIDNGRALKSRDNVVSFRLFYGCRSLNKLVLPRDITSIEAGAFALCPSLRELDIPEGDDKTYILKNHTLYPKNDTCHIQEVLPSFHGKYVIPKGATTIDDYAFSACLSLSQVEIPSTLTKVGSFAFQNCLGLSTIKISSYDVPETGHNVFDGVEVRSCKLQVPAGSKDRFKRHQEWGVFAGGSGYSAFDNIEEFGSAITARNAGRYYGEENPKLGYQVNGDIPNGSPELTCDADVDSPVGDYVIHVAPGTITDEIVKYFDGTLHVWAAPLKVTVGDYTRMEGEENPEFSLEYEGFKLNEGMEVITELPVVVCEADASSPVGTYPIRIKGGLAPNYEFKYKTGTLTIEPNPLGITEIAEGQNGHQEAYTLDGRRVKADNLRQLPKGIYIVNGKKVTVK